MSEEPRYALAGVELEAERGRLRRLEGLQDGASLRRLDALGVAAGWRCLEVGAGAGSVARALAERVGVQGEVVAADRDPRFLDDFPGPGRRVVTHDITTGPVPPADFDLVHCRAVLAHVEDLPGAVRNLVACARKGGLVLVEEPDYAGFEACDPAHPRAEVFARFAASMKRGDRMHPDAGRRVFAAMIEAGLEDVACDATSAIVRGGSPRARYRRHTMENARALSIASGAWSEEGLDALLACFEDPSFHYVDNLWVGVSARVPG